MKTRLISAAIALVIVADGALVARAEQQAPRAVAEALDAANAAFSAAYVRGDAAALAAMYTSDGVLLPPGRRVEGRDGIERFFTPGGARKLLSHVLKAESRTVHGDTVVEVGTYSSTAQTGDQPAVTRSERYLLVWRRQPGGGWQIQYDMWHLQAAR